MKRFCAIVLTAALAACSNAATGVSPGNALIPNARPHTTGSISLPKGYRIKVFARGKDLTNPDPIVVQDGLTYVAYQNATNPDGTGGNSTIVEYSGNATGKERKKLSVPGRCDGMRWDPYTNVMWITLNEDANSQLYTWDPKTGAVAKYAWSSAKHGGGYDDLAFANNMAFVAASNPTLDSAGKNTGPAVIAATLNGGTATVTPVLMGNATAKDVVSGQTVTLNLTDPDSMTVAPNGDVLLVSQGDSEIVFIHDAGLSTQSVSRLLVGTQLDDTTYAAKKAGSMLIADAKADAIYRITGHWTAGQLYTEAPSDSGVAGFVGSVNATTGTMTPIFAGFQSPTGLLYVP